MSASKAMEPEACDVFHLDAMKVKKVRAALMGAGAVAALAETFKLLGDSTRVRILDALSKEELCVCDLANLLDLTASAVSHQLRLLRGVRLVRPRRDGRMVFYALDDHHIISLFQQGLRHVEEETKTSSITRPVTQTLRSASRGVPPSGNVRLPPSHKASAASRTSAS